MPSWRESYLTGVAIQDLFSYMWTDHRPYSPLLSPLARLKVFSPSSSSFSHPLLLTDVNEFQINVIYWSLCLACLTWFQSPLSPYLATLCLPRPEFSSTRELGPDFSSTTAFLLGTLALHLILNEFLMKPLTLTMKQSSSSSLQHQYFTTYVALNLKDQECSCFK